MSKRKKTTLFDQRIALVIDKKLKDEIHQYSLEHSMSIGEIHRTALNKLFEPWRRKKKKEINNKRKKEQAFLVDELYEKVNLMRSRWEDDSLEEPSAEEIDDFLGLVTRACMHIEDEGYYP